MTTLYRGEDDVINYPNSGADIAVNAIVEMGAKTIGVAMQNIASGATGPVAIKGRFTVPKAAGTDWAVGDRVDWDTSAGNFGKGITAAAGDIVGAAICTKTAATADTTGEVAFMPGNAVT